MSFYRKYRPQVIEEIDNISVREQLLSLLTKDKASLPHAYFFSGPRGVGKTTAARVIAKLFNCTNPSANSGPCGTCDQCISIAKGNNLDLLEIDAASNRGIDEMRTLRDAIALSPSRAAYKIYIIDEVHMLTTEACNALLKTLEEPPPHAVFVLATTDPQKVPITIRSRCMIVNFPRADSLSLLEALKRIVKKEDMDVDAQALEKIAFFADGSFRDAVKYLEQTSFHTGKITTAVVQKLLSMSDEKIVEEFLSSVTLRDAKASLGLIEQLVDDGKDIKAFLTDVLRRLEKMLVATVMGEKSDIWSMGDLKDAIGRFSQAFSEMRGVSIVQLPLELAVVEYCEEKSPALPQTHTPPSLGLLTLEKLTDCWKDFIEYMKPYNHSVAGVLRSARPKAVKDGIVTIEAFYTFHQEKLNESKTREALSQTLKKLFGEKVKVEVVLGKK